MADEDETVVTDEDETLEGSIAHPPEGEQEDSLESEETLSPDERGEE